VVQQRTAATKMAEKKAPVFKKVADLRPGTHGHNLHVKVITITLQQAAAQEASTINMLDLINWLCWVNVCPCRSSRHR
jgi:hypothetical protein